MNNKDLRDALVEVLDAKGFADTNALKSLLLNPEYEEIFDFDNMPTPEELSDEIDKYQENAWYNVKAK